MKRRVIKTILQFLHLSNLKSRSDSAKKNFATTIHPVRQKQLENDLISRFATYLKLILKYFIFIIASNSPKTVHSVHNTIFSI